MDWVMRLVRAAVRICIFIMLLYPLLLAHLKYTGGSILEYEDKTYTQKEVEEIAWRERKRALEVSAFEFNRTYLIWHSVPLILLVLADWWLGREKMKLTKNHPNKALQSHAPKPRD